MIRNQNFLLVICALERDASHDYFLAVFQSFFQIRCRVSLPSFYATIYENNEKGKTHTHTHPIRIKILHLHIANTYYRKKISNLIGRFIINCINNS